MSFLFINKTLWLNNLKTRTAINAKISVFVICVNAIAYLFTARKVTKYGVFFGPYFPVFGLNTEIYSVNVRIQSKCRKIQTRNNSVFGQQEYCDVNSCFTPISLEETIGKTLFKKAERVEVLWRTESIEIFASCY